MPLYWTDASVPELAKLTRGQRRHVRCTAYKMLRAEHPGTPLLMGLFCGLGVFFGYFLAWPVSRLTTAGDRPLVWILGGAVGGGIGGLIAGSRQTERLRPYFKRFIEEHTDEIAKVP